MAGLTSPELLRWESSRDDEGYRVHKAVHKVKVANLWDGPFVVMSTPGLPQIGSPWNFGNDFDYWAFCLPKMKVTRAPGIEEEPGYIWHVEQEWTNKPQQRCQDTQIEDPLLEPMAISGSFVRFTREFSVNKDGEPLKTSSHELLRGPITEFDDCNATVVISQNVPNNELDVFTAMMNRVNSAPLWGMAARHVKLSNVTWSRQVQGTCSFYYSRTFEFDVNFDGFDREAQDEGTKVLHGHWEDSGWVLDNINGSPPDPDNPQHFDQFKDRNGENTSVILDGSGKPALTGTPGTIEIKRYSEANFLLLGIPTSL